MEELCGIATCPNCSGRGEIFGLLGTQFFDHRKAEVLIKVDKRGKFLWEADMKLPGKAVQRGISCYYSEG